MVARTLFGDAVWMHGKTVGGDDRLFCRDRGGLLIGDAGVMNNDAVGGDDFLVAKGMTRDCCQVLQTSRLQAECPRNCR